MRSAVAVVEHKMKSADLFARFSRSIGITSGLLNAVFGLSISGVAAQDADYRSAVSAPASWQAFAMQLQGRFQQRLSADDKDARSFQEYMTKRAAGADASPLIFVARTWVLPDGKVERLEFDGLDDDRIALQLGTLLTRDNVGVPPPDMLQPLRLRLSLRPKEQPAGGQVK